VIEHRRTRVEGLRGFRLVLGKWRERREHRFSMNELHGESTDSKHECEDGARTCEVEDWFLMFLGTNVT
jgi:hypothetical protein